MLEWLVQTCRYFATRRDLQLLIRVHPAEISGFPPSRQPILRSCVGAFRSSPPNIVVVPPESGLSTYALMSLCNAAIIYGTKMGVELTQRRPAGHRGGRSVDPQQGNHLRRQHTRGVLPRSSISCRSPRAWPGATGAGAPLRLSLLLQPDDPAAVHRAQRRLPDVPARS